jgi:hypothetical protein
MMVIMKSLEMFALTFQGSIPGKPLPAKEFFVVGIIKMLNDAIAPRFPNRDKHWLNAVI